MNKIWIYTARVFIFSLFLFACAIFLPREALSACSDNPYSYTYTVAVTTDACDTETHTAAGSCQNYYGYCGYCHAKDCWCDVEGIEGKKGYTCESVGGGGCSDGYFVQCGSSGGDGGDTGCNCGSQNCNYSIAGCACETNGCKINGDPGSSCSNKTCGGNDPPPSYNPKGFHDGSDCNNSSGWTCDQNDFNTALHVRFYADGPAGTGTSLGSTTADIAATDDGVAAACGGYAKHRFSFPTPDFLKDGTTHTIYAYALNVGGGSDTLLQNSPKSISCPTPVPNCKNVTGPASLYVGDTGTYQATYEGLVSMAGMAVTSASCANYASWQQIPGGPGSYSFSWKPSNPGTYEVDCRAWNDNIAECRGNCVDGPPRYPCVGPGAKMLVNVLALTKAWWQVKDADVLANGNINSEVPDTKYFDLVGEGGYPGVPVYKNSTNLTSSNVSTSKWLANAPYSGTKMYNSNYFINLIPSAVTDDPSSIIITSNIDVSDLLTKGKLYNGYRYIIYDGTSKGDLTISNPDNATLDSIKTILIVKNASININGKINGITKGTGFFLAVTSGNINVAASVGGSTGFGLEGIYVSDGTFSTGTTGAKNDLRLMVRGSIASYAGINLERDLGNVNNAAYPAEFFEYAPDLELLFPVELSSHVTNWREIAP